MSRRIFAIISVIFCLTLILSFGLAGCGEDDETDTNKDNVITDTPNSDSNGDNTHSEPEDSSAPQEPSEPQEPSVPQEPSEPSEPIIPDMPDNNTENLNNLKGVKRIEQLIKDSGDYAEFSAEKIERCMFGVPNFLEENAFTTGHQLVNVYGVPEKCYEIRSEDNAIDVQIHKQESKSDTERKVYNKRFGEGEIIKREERGDKICITVQFKNRIVMYDENCAFESGNLSWI